MSKSIHCYNLPHKLKETLIYHRLTMSGDLLNLSAVQLSNITRLPIEECEVVVKVVNNKDPLFLSPASIRLKQELTSSGILTLSDQLNELLNDGFPLGRLCEIAGASGTGKTQLCFQLCVTVQLPRDVGGLEADALYIDVDNSFRFNRIAEIVRFLQDKVQDRKVVELDEGRISDHVFVERCFNLTHLQVLILEKLEPYLKQNSKLRLIIVDSIAYLIRYDFEGRTEQRNALLWTMSNKLRQLAATYNLCVVVTNHVRYDPESQSIKPALGNRWGHYCALRLFLDKHELTGRRIATLTKSVKQREASINFSIGPQGVCDEIVEKPNSSKT